MQLLQLYYFKVLAENEHLLNTAKQIHISPPALSSTIAKLENELQVSLFDRIGRNIRLNDNGKILYSHVCNIFSELDIIHKELDRTNSRHQNTVNVGVTAMSLWNEVIGNFMLENPSIIINHSIILKDQLANTDYLDSFDLIITDINDIRNLSWNSSLIIEDYPVLLVNLKHPFAKNVTIPLYAARNEPFVALTKGYSSRAYFDESCKKAGFVPHIVAETDYMLRTQLIKNGTGISFSTILGAEAIDSPDIIPVRLDATTTPRMQSVFYKKGTNLSSGATLFRDYLINYYNKDNQLLYL